MPSKAGEISIFDMSCPVTVLPPDENGIQGVSVVSMFIEADTVKYPFIYPPFPEHYLAPIGAIIVSWGSFEESFDELLRKCLTLNNKNDHLRISFRARMAMFRREVTAALGDIDGMQQFIDMALTASDGIYWKRNVLAHGQLHFMAAITPKVPTTDDDVLCHIGGQARQDGRTFEHNFTMQELKVLFYDIAHLHGKLRCVVEPKSPISAPYMPEEVRLEIARRYESVGIS